MLRCAGATVKIKIAILNTTPATRFGRILLLIILGVFDQRMNFKFVTKVALPCTFAIGVSDIAGFTLDTLGRKAREQSALFSGWWVLRRSSAALNFRFHACLPCVKVHGRTEVAVTPEAASACLRCWPGLEPAGQAGCLAPGRPRKRRNSGGTIDNGE